MHQHIDSAHWSTHKSRTYFAAQAIVFKNILPLSLHALQHISNDLNSNNPFLHLHTLLSYTFHKLYTYISWMQNCPTHISFVSVLVFTIISPIASPLWDWWYEYKYLLSSSDWKFSEPARACGVVLASAYAMCGYAGVIIYPTPDHDTKLNGGCPYGWLRRDHLTNNPYFY